jgi:hypothetical protein
LDLAQKTDIIIRQANQHLNEKIKNMLTLASALIPTVAGLSYFIADEAKIYWILIPIFFSILAFVVAIAFGTLLFMGSGFHLYVDPKFIVDKYNDKNKSLRFFFNKWAHTYCDVANTNADVVNAKLKRIKYMNYCLIAGLAIFALSFLLLAISLAWRP